ncbi:MAG: ATP-dependent helicase, partial [Polyangiaceae bacterium]
FAIGTELDDDPVIRIRSAAGEIGRQLGERVPPHRLVGLLRALRRQGLLLLDKFGPDLYRVRFQPGAIAARDSLRRIHRVVGALFEHLEEHLGKSRGRDLVVTLDVNAFVERPTLTEKLGHEETVSACLLLHHLDAWHLADPPVLFDTAMKVRVDPSARLGQIDAKRPARQHQHEIELVHMVREYAVMPPSRRRQYVDDYFRMGAEQLAEKYFYRRKQAIRRPVSAATEAEIVEGLTPAQKDAVTATDRAVLVVAGPGSGKTHTVVRRIGHMVRARQIRAEHILVLAFNRAAAAELRQRLADALGPRAAWVDVRTFHSLAVKLTGAELYDGKGDADPEARLDAAMVEAAALLSGADEDDRERAIHLRQQVLGGVKHVLVDEYQDLDPSQYALLTALVGLDTKRRGLDRTERSVYVVGDDDQAIYGFRNASVTFLRRFVEEFGARRIGLCDNFRSNRAIVRAAQAFAETIPDRLKTEPDEQMRPASGALEGDERAVRRLRFSNAGEMAAHAAYAVQRMLEDPEHEQRTIAILARHWSSLHPVRFLLERAGVEVTIHHRGFKRPVHRRHPVAYLLGKLWRKREPLRSTATEWVIAQLEHLGRDLAEPVCRELLAIVADVDAERKSAGQIPLFGAGRAPYERRLAGSRGGQLQLLAAEDVDHETAAIEHPLHAPMTTAELADAIVLGSRDAALRDRTSSSSGCRVHLSTYHGAKGLEFDHVIVLPTRGRGDDAEERRLYFVAISRARHELSLATLGDGGSLGDEIEAPVVDLRGVGRRLGTVRARYLDAEPSDMRLLDRELARHRGYLAKLREGDPLAIEERDDEIRLLYDGRLVGKLSRAGRRRFDRLRDHGPVRARVHEIYQHHQRDEHGTIKSRWLVVLPTMWAGRGA